MVMRLKDIKTKTPAELLDFAEQLEIENASALKRQDLMFTILKKMAENEVEISGEGLLEVLQDGFGFLRSPEANYIAGSDDIYVSTSQIRKYSFDSFRMEYHLLYNYP